MTEPTPSADLVAALGALTNIAKTGRVEAGQRRYAFVELDELLDAARPILLAHRLVLTQDIATDDTGALDNVQAFAHAEAVAARLVEVICRMDEEAEWYTPGSLEQARHQRDAARAEVAALRRELDDAALQARKARKDQG